MQVFFGIEGLEREWGESVVCIGTFDGVHLGHKALVRQAVDRAASLGLPTVLATFDRNPAAVLAPEKCPPSIASLQSNLEEFDALGVAITVVIKFDRALSEISAELFFAEVLVERLGAKAMVVGHDFTFGKNRIGTPGWLEPRIATETIAPFMVDGVRVSSSQIRTAVLAGDVRFAAALLGRPFEIPGIVVGARKLGRKIGYPTINLARSFHQVTPDDGIYAGTCQTPIGRFKAAVSIGSRPTVDANRTIEAFLIDYPGREIYGAPVRLSLLEKLRDAVKFETLEELSAQIGEDVARAASIEAW